MNSNFCSAVAVFRWGVLGGRRILGSHEEGATEFSFSSVRAGRETRNSYLRKGVGDSSSASYCSQRGALKSAANKNY
jgi:hypothetical protein